MRSILAWSLGALLLGAAAVTGCVDQAEQHPARARAAIAPAPTPQPQASGPVVVQHGNEKGVTEAQPAAPPPPPYTVGDERAHVSRAVAAASQQIDRLRRMLETADPEHRDELDTAIHDLQSRRERVLQDMREYEMRGAAVSPTVSDALRSEMDRDLDALQSALHDSYDLAPPPGSGMAPPAPLPPSHP